MHVERWLYVHRFKDYWMLWRSFTFHLVSLRLAFLVQSTQCFLPLSPSCTWASWTPTNKKMYKAFAPLVRKRNELYWLIYLFILLQQWQYFSQPWGLSAGIFQAVYNCNTMRFGNQMRPSIITWHWQFCRPYDGQTLNTVQADQSKNLNLNLWKCESNRLE